MIFIDIIIFIIATIAYYFIFSMIVLNLFFGIPKTIKLKKDKILLDEAPITPFIITAILWIFIFSIITYMSHLIFKENIFEIISMAITFGFIISFNNLSKDNSKANYDDLFKTQQNYINLDLINSFIAYKNNNFKNFSMIKNNNIKDENLKNLEENAPPKKEDL